MTVEASADVLIIGGGVVGLMSARELAKAGARVLLLERQGIGQESSWAGGGILSPLYPWRAAAPITALSRWSQQAYPALIDEVKSATGIDPEWLPSGLLISGCEDSDAAVSWCLSQGVHCDTLDGAALQRMEPNLAIHPAHSLNFPDIAQVRNPRLLKALYEDLIRRKVRVLEHHEVLGFERGPESLTAVLTANGRFVADRYVIAGGAWSRGIAAELAEGLRVEPVKGQMLVFAAIPGLIQRIVLHDGRYLIPRRDGKVLVGSTVEYTGFDKATSQDAFTALTDFAVSVLPALEGYPVEKHWAGLRPGSPDGIPTIAAHPACANLFFNCGQFRNGFALAPASTRLLADLLLAREPILPVEPYRLP